MNKTKVGFLTIGQSPRDDVMSEMKPLLAPNVEAVEYGVLDGYTHEEIESLMPKTQDIPLVSRLRDGSQVLLSEKKIIELLPEAIEFMYTKLNAGAIGILCTHEFPKREYLCPVIFPSDYIKFVVDEVLKAKRLGVVVPLESQIEMTRQKWGIERTYVVPKSPYVKGQNWKSVADDLVKEKIDAVVLDCIGFSVQDRDDISSFLNIPVLLPRAILLSAINHIF